MKKERLQNFMTLTIFDRFLHKLIHHPSLPCPPHKVVLFETSNSMLSLSLFLFSDFSNRKKTVAVCFTKIPSFPSMTLAMFSSSTGLHRLSSPLAPTTPPHTHTDMFTEAKPAWRSGAPLGGHVANWETLLGAMEPEVRFRNVTPRWPLAKHFGLEVNASQRLGKPRARSCFMIGQRQAFHHPANKGRQTLAYIQGRYTPSHKTLSK